jgi:hypothetical protein
MPSGVPQFGQAGISSAAGTGACASRMTGAFETSVPHWAQKATEFQVWYRNLDMFS